jgi:hypothetical protein
VEYNIFNNAILRNDINHLKSASTASVTHNLNGKHKIPALNEDSLVSNYLTNVAVVNESTAQKYNERLKKFSLFVYEANRSL